MNVTVMTVSSQSRHRLEIGTRPRPMSAPRRGIAQSLKPIVGDRGQSAAHERAVSLMQTRWGQPVSVPDSQHRQHASREGAMYRQIRAQDTVPVFDGTASPDGPIPGCQQGLGQRSPVGRHVFEQVLAAGTKDGSPSPGPAQQMQGLWSQCPAYRRLHLIHCWRQERQLWQSCPQPRQQCPQLVLHGSGSCLTQFVEQAQHGLQFPLPHRTGNDPLPRVARQHHHLHQAVQVARQGAQTVGYLALGRVRRHGHRHHSWDAFLAVPGLRPVVLPAGPRQALAVPGASPDDPGALGSADRGAVHATHRVDEAALASRR